jgi:two-component system NarL family sensor kinase
LFRIVQEALNNVRKHSGATRAEITLLRKGEDVKLEIRDNGRGFKVDLACAALGVGIAGMRERVRQLGGRLNIQSSSSGTVVEAILPVQFGMAVAADASVR